MSGADLHRPVTIVGSVPATLRTTLPVVTPVRVPIPPEPTPVGAVTVGATQVASPAVEKIARTPASSRPALPSYSVTTILHQGWEALPENPRGVDYPGLVRMATLNDDSSLLHAVANAALTSYRTGEIKGRTVKQEEWIRVFRDDLATYLDQPHPKSQGKVTYYNFLAGGEIAKLAQSEPTFSLENMVKTLKGTDILKIEYLEYISEFMDLDIYVIDLTIMDVHRLGLNDYSLMYSGRKRSIVIGTVGDHFETIGIRVGPAEIPTAFTHKHPLIRLLRKRLGAD